MRKLQKNILLHTFYLTSKAFLRDEMIEEHELVEMTSPDQAFIFIEMSKSIVEKFNSSNDFFHQSIIFNLIN
jgi:hypothetical protein